MLGNSWFKKEKPFLGLTGFGGGVGSNLVAGAATEATGGTVYYYSGKTIHKFTAPGTFEVPAALPASSVEYVLIGGGGGGGQDDGGGAGAGAYREGTQPVPAATYTVTIGEGGAQKTTGEASVFGPLTATGGGSGGTDGSGPNGGAGGSGGGGAGGFPDGSAGPGSGDTYPGTRTDPVPANGWGNDGGSGRDNTGPAPYSGGGGGGATGLGAGPTQGNYGGQGIQLPTTFQDPTNPVGSPGSVGYQAPTSPGDFWVAGGGGGTRTNTPNTGSGAGVGGTGGGGGGGSNPARPGSNPPGSGANGATNTGSGGGGGDVNNDPTSVGGTGADGLLLIAYPT